MISKPPYILGCSNSENDSSVYLFRGSYPCVLLFEETINITAYLDFLKNVVSCRVVLLNQCQ